MPNNNSNGEQTEAIKEFINDRYALIDENSNYDNNCGNYKISVFMSPKTVITGGAMFTDVLKLEYNRDVKRLVLEDSLYSIGLRGYMEVDNTSSWLDKVLNRINQIYVIINITEYENINGQIKPFVKYEPYIFDISYVENVNSPDKNPKVLRIGLMDCVTSIIEQHSIASVIQFNRNITTATSYKRVFQYIHEYIKDHINTNLINKFEWKKDLLYDESCTFISGNTSGNDTEAQMSWLVQDTFGKISRDATIAEALNIIYKDACTTMFAPSRFKSQYQDIGNVLIPFFFKEEYPDRFFLYPSLWKNSNDDNSLELNQTSGSSSTETEQTSQTGTSTATTQPGQSTASTTSQTNEQGSSFVNRITTGIQNIADKIRNNSNNQSVLYNKTYGGKSDHLLYRQMTMRDIYMPFVLAFGADDYGCVFETISPSNHQKNKNLISINGETTGEVHDMQYDPVRIKDLKKLWKNVIFIACSNENTAGDSTLIFFSWFYDYFINVFLNESIDAHVIRKRFACASPAFHKMMINEGVEHGGATKVDAKGFVNKVDEHNSYIYSTRTQDTVNECMRVMGKNIASFVLANDSYTFSIYGNLRRRPNEIIKFCFTPNSEDGSISATSAATGIFDVNHVYLYVSSVTHEFVGNEYKNIIKTYKFMEETNF